MKAMKAGVTKAGKGIDNIAWNILGQTYVPKQLCESSFSWHALLPPGTFVPPHIHTNQDEFIYVLEGRFDLILDGKEVLRENVTRAAAPEQNRVTVKLRKGQNEVLVKVANGNNPHGMYFAITSADELKLGK